VLHVTVNSWSLLPVSAVTAYCELAKVLDAHASGSQVMDVKLPPDWQVVVPSPDAV